MVLTWRREYGLANEKHRTTTSDLRRRHHELEGQNRRGVLGGISRILVRHEDPALRGQHHVSEEERCPRWDIEDPRMS